MTAATVTASAWTARAWTGHLRGQWGGWGQAELAAGGWLDAAGWPTTRLVSEGGYRVLEVAPR